MLFEFEMMSKFMFFSSTKINSTATMIEFFRNFFTNFLITKFIQFAETWCNVIYRVAFFYMSIISNHQIEMRFFLTHREIDVNCLSTFKFAFLIAYNFKLLAKIKNSTKKSEYCWVLIFFLSIVKFKHMSYSLFEFFIRHCRYWLKQNFYFLFLSFFY